MYVKQNQTKGPTVISDAEFEAMLSKLFKQKFTARDDFKEELLARCLAVLGEENEVPDWETGSPTYEDGRELADSELDMLAAAGDPSLLIETTSDIS